MKPPRIQKNTGRFWCPVYWTDNMLHCYQEVKGMKELQFYNKSFEKTVRKELQIFDRPITEADARKVKTLNCWEFTFDIEDCDTLSAFSKLTCLEIVIGFEDLSFFKNLTSLTRLYINFFESNFDICYLLPLKQLEILIVSGGDLSDFIFHNFERIAEFPNLKDIGLHEFGTVDLVVLKDMPYIKGFFCGWADKVYNIEAISNLVNLEYLGLYDVVIQNLNFMRSLPNEIHLELCGIRILDRVDLAELRRFKECILDEIEINGERVI